MQTVDVDGICTAGSTKKKLDEWQRGKEVVRCTNTKMLLFPGLVGSSRRNSFTRCWYTASTDETNRITDETNRITLMERVPYSSAKSKRDLPSTPPIQVVDCAYFLRQKSEGLLAKDRSAHLLCDQQTESQVTTSSHSVGTATALLNDNLLSVMFSDLR